MAISVGGIESTIDLRIGTFIRSADAVVKKLDQVEKKSEKVVKKVENIGPVLSRVGVGFAAFGATITAAFVPALLAAEKTDKKLGELRKSVGQEVALLNQAVGQSLVGVLTPALEAMERGVRIARVFADTGLGRIVLQVTLVVGALATFGGGLLILGAKLASAIAALKTLGLTATVVSGAMKTLGLAMLKVVAVIAALEIGLQLADLVNQSEKFRVATQRTFAGIAFIAEKAKGVIGKGNEELAESYRKIAAGEEQVGQEELKRQSITSRVIELQKLLTAAMEESNVVTQEQIELKTELAAVETASTVIPPVPELEPALPMFSEESQREIEEVANEQTEVLQTPFEEATGSAIRFGQVAFETISAVTTLAGGLADTITGAIVGSIQNAGKSFGQFFKQFMIQIATMIARALILAAILSFLPGGGGFGLQLGKFFGKGKPFDEPSNDQILRGEGGRMADLLLQGMGSRMDRTGGGAETRVASSEVERSSFAPVVEVHEATEMTWVRVTDRHIEPRIRERLDRQTVRS